MSSQPIPDVRTHSCRQCNALGRRSAVLDKSPSPPSENDVVIHESMKRNFEDVFARVTSCSREVLEALLELAVEIAREGREGRRIGTLFTLGEAESVLGHSRGLILDPLAGHVPHATSIFDGNLRGTIKELAQLDGAFVLASDGTVSAACRYLDAEAAGVHIPLGLGSRHLAAASMSRRFKLVAVVVSESAVVRVFHAGELVAEIIPELWLLRRHMQPALSGPVTEGTGRFGIVTTATETTT